jgi:hypothetical protein
MAHFAEIRTDTNRVLRVIVISDSQCSENGGENTAELEQWVKNNHANDPIIEQELGTYPETIWKQTSYNTYLNEHANGGTPLRGNYAGIGHIYDSENDIFYCDKPFDSWILDLSIADWKAPIAYPSVETYGDGAPYTIRWDENNLRWLGYTSDEQEFAWNPEITSWVATGN